MSTIGEKIRSAREAKGWSQEELANAAGVSQTTIDKIERGLTKRSRFLHYITSQLNLNPAELDPEMYIAGQPQIAREVLNISNKTNYEGRGLLPVYASEIVDNDDGSDGSFIALSSSPLDYVPKPSFLEGSPDAYGVYVSDRLMSPEIEAGDIVLFDPRLPFVIDATCIFIAHGSDLRIIGRLADYDKEKWIINQWGNQNSLKFSRRDFPRLDRAVAKFYRR